MTNAGPKTRVFKPAKFVGIDVINSKSTAHVRRFAPPNSTRIWNTRF